MDNKQSAHEYTEHYIGMHLADVERDLILATLRQMDGNRTHAAKALGISIRTMRNKLRAYAFDEADISGSVGA
jgi:DNA-binding NtrC family response regulator